MDFLDLDTPKGITSNEPLECPLCAAPSIGTCPICELKFEPEEPMKSQEEIHRELQADAAYEGLDDNGCPKEDRRPDRPKLQRLDLYASPEAFARQFGGGSGSVSGKEPVKREAPKELAPLPPDAGIPADYPRGHPLSKAAPRIVWEFVEEDL